MNDTVKELEARAARIMGNPSQIAFKVDSPHLITDLLAALKASQQREAELVDALEKADEILDAYRCEIDDHCAESQSAWDYAAKQIRQALNHKKASE